MNIVISLIAASSFSIAFPLLAGIFHYGRLPRELKILLLSFAVGTVEEIITVSLFLQHRNIYWIYHLYAPIQYSLIVLVFSYWMDNRRLRTIALYSIPVFWVISLILTLTVEGLSHLNNISISISYSAYILIASYILYVIQKKDKGSIRRDPRFWIASALLFSSACSLGYFAFNGIIFKYSMREIWAIHNLSNVIGNTLYGVGFLCCPPQLNYSGA